MVALLAAAHLHVGGGQEAVESICVTHVLSIPCQGGAAVAREPGKSLGSPPYVASHANIADLPSRGALGEMAAALRSIDSSFSLEGSAVRMELPDISDGLLERAATDLAAARGSRGGRSSRGAKRRRA